MPPRPYVVIAAVLAAACSNLPAIVITDVGVNYSENFDSLAASGSTGSTLPASWSSLESGTNANATYGVSTGSSTTGNTYSYGTSGSSDRALGSLRTGTLVPMFGVEISNATGLVIDALDIGYSGEQWRLGTLGRLDRLDFQFSVDATSLDSGNWADLDALDFIAPTSSGAVGLLDGNLAANRTGLAGSITGLNLADGASMWLRWTDWDASGSDDGLAIDDFGVTARRANPTSGHAVPDAVPMAGALGATLLGLAALRRGLPGFERAA